MQNRLNEKKRRAIAENYSEHPLYKTCRYAFKRNETQMEVLRFAPEEVFVEAVDVIDNLTVERDDEEDYLALLWDDLKTKIRSWEPKTKDAELDMAVSSILYISAEAVSTVRSQDYDNLAVKLLRLIHANVAVSMVDHRRILDDMAHYQEDLELWMEGYLNETRFLSDEIVELLHPKKGKAGGRTARDPETITDTFLLVVEEKEEITNLRLTMVARDLKSHRFISDSTDQMLVFKFFQGEPFDTKIEWTASIGELKYFIETIADCSFIQRSGSAGHWQIACAHFKQKKVSKAGEVSYKNFTPEQLKNGKSKQAKEIDDIISYLNPQLINAQRIRELLTQAKTEAEVYKRDILDSGMSIR